MSATSEKAPKKEKVKRQTPEERQEALRYNRMMYGPTANEARATVKRIDYGAAYLKHPKFQELMTAFKKGAEFQFNVTDKGKSYTISTDGSQILFAGKVVFYSRYVNKYENNLLLDRSVALQLQAIDAFVHLAIAVLRALPELDAPSLTFGNDTFFYGDASLEAGISTDGPNLMIGSFRTGTPKPKKG